MPRKLPENLVVPVRKTHTEQLCHGALRLWASGKINLNLLVSPREADGYHPIDSLVVRVSLYDQIELRYRSDGQIRLVSLGIDCGPKDENLVLRAGRTLAEIRSPSGQPLGADITLIKNIPPGKGLGGGSADAAAVLTALNKLWELGLDDAELASIAFQLGADVPLFLGPTAVRMTGRGEHLEPINVHSFTAVLVLPDLTCHTPAVYAAFDDEEIPIDSQLDPMILKLAPSRWRGQLRNHLERPARRVAPQLAELLEQLRRCVSLPVHMTGSGAGLFILCDKKREAATVLNQIPPELLHNCLIVQNNPW